MSIDKDLLDIQKEVHNQLKSSTEKFAYYIIALCVSCLGFAIYQTEDHVLDYSKIILLLAVLTWSISIYFGIKYIKNQQYGLYLSYILYENQRNKFELSKDNIDKIKYVNDEFKEEIRITGKKTKRQHKHQLNSFFIGAFFYIIWHIFEMYNNTFHSCC